MKQSRPAILPHVIAVLTFIILPSFYFPSMFQGKELNQSDIAGYQGAAKEIIDYRKETGKDALWTNSMFSGMPAYLINMKRPNNILAKVYKILTLPSARPVIHIFLYMLGFYLLLLMFGVNPWLGIVGSIAYGFSSYFFIILVPGHVTKAIALGYMPMIVGSVYYTFKKDFLTGGILTSIFIGLQLIANHLQITYYTVLIILIFGIFELIRVIREHDFPYFLRAVAASILAVVLAVSINIVTLWTVAEYSSYSLRGPSELTKESKDQTSGLNKSYATAWSYGIGETLDLLIPNFKGGASNQLLANRDSKTFQYLSKNGGPQQAVKIINSNPYFFTQYWGDQPGTSGPVYIGAVVVFLFVFGMFFLRGQVRWWLFTVTVFAILLSWGKNLNFLTEFFLEHFPGYNKFRTVSMILVMAELAMPLLALLAMQKLIFGEYTKKQFTDALKYATYIIGGICLLFALFPGLSDLSSQTDKILLDQGAGDLVSALREDRASLLRSDAFRSLVFVLLTALLVLGYQRKKVTKPLFFVALGLLFLIDLWPVNKRYLNSDNFVRKSVAETPFKPNQADLQILKDTTLSYRVLDLSQGSPFNSARASYFHKSIGGYHGAKMRRYQELYDHYIEGKPDNHILDMLNTKYIIQRDPKNNKIIPVRRTTNLGNAWFVSKYKMAENADQEIALLGDIDPAKTAVIDQRFSEFVDNVRLKEDSSSHISLQDYAPDKLIYNYATKTSQIAVFSEIYYPKGWKVSINGEPANEFRVDYVLRALTVPAGKGTITFEFRPESYYVGAKISLAGSVILVLLTIGLILRELGIIRINVQKPS